jgi:demethylmenaquinone methyltransferase/2-methoxy-6-polyprenyl-1,4-benzoquinol methylase
MLREGVRAVERTGLSGRVAFVLGRAERLPFPDASFDGLSFTYLLRYVDDPQATLAELARVLRPGGSMASLEFGVPPPPWRVAWWLHVHGVMPAVGRAVSPAWLDVARFLGPSIEGFVARHPLGDQLAWWRRAGLEGVSARRLSFGAAVVTWGAKRAE